MPTFHKSNTFRGIKKVIHTKNETIKLKTDGELICSDSLKKKIKEVANETNEEHSDETMNIDTILDEKVFCDDIFADDQTICVVKKNQIYLIEISNGEISTYDLEHKQLLAVLNGSLFFRTDLIQTEKSALSSKNLMKISILTKNMEKIHQYDDVKYFRTFKQSLCVANGKEVKIYDLDLNLKYQIRGSLITCAEECFIVDENGIKMYKNGQNVKADDVLSVCGTDANSLDGMPILLSHEDLLIVFTDDFFYFKNNEEFFIDDMAEMLNVRSDKDFVPYKLTNMELYQNKVELLWEDGNLIEYEIKFDDKNGFELAKGDENKETSNDFMIQMSPQTQMKPMDTSDSEKTDSSIKIEPESYKKEDGEDYEYFNSVNDSVAFSVGDSIKSQDLRELEEKTEEKLQAKTPTIETYADLKEVSSSNLSIETFTEKNNEKNEEHASIQQNKTPSASQESIDSYNEQEDFSKNELSSVGSSDNSDQPELTDVLYEIKSDEKSTQEEKSEKITDMTASKEKDTRDELKNKNEKSQDELRESEPLKPQNQSFAAYEPAPLKNPFIAPKQPVKSFTETLKDSQIGKNIFTSQNSPSLSNLNTEKSKIPDNPFTNMKAASIFDTKREKDTTNSFSSQLNIDKPLSSSKSVPQKESEIKTSPSTSALLNKPTDLPDLSNLDLSNQVKQSDSLKSLFVKSPIKEEKKLDVPADLPDLSKLSAVEKKPSIFSQNTLEKPKMPSLSTQPPNPFAQNLKMPEKSDFPLSKDQPPNPFSSNVLSSDNKPKSASLSSQTTNPFSSQFPATIKPPAMNTQVPNPFVASPMVGNAISQAAPPSQINKPQNLNGSKPEQEIREKKSEQTILKETLQGELNQISNDFSLLHVNTFELPDPSEFDVNVDYQSAFEEIQTFKELEELLKQVKIFIKENQSDEIKIENFLKTGNVNYEKYLSYIDEKIAQSRLKLRLKHKENKPLSFDSSFDSLSKPDVKIPMAFGDCKFNISSQNPSGPSKTEKPQNGAKSVLDRYSDEILGELQKNLCKLNIKTPNTAVEGQQQNLEQTPLQPQVPQPVQEPVPPQNPPQMFSFPNIQLQQQTVPQIAKTGSTFAKLFNKQDDFLKKMQQKK